MNPFLKTALYLLSKPYASYMAIRNKLYNTKTLSSSKAKLPTIGIGNITIGGTGKTPHAEYIISLLKDNYKLAYLSRGYKRKTKGWRDCNKDASAKNIGDEAFQVHCKFPEITVAVCENRLKGISNIEKFHPQTDIVILDDVYQHRKLQLDVNILLIDFNRLVYYDHIIPLGRLRENAKNTDRADIIIITKCPENMRPVDCLATRSQINPYPYQKLLFSKIVYNNLLPLYNTDINIYDKSKKIIAVSGLARNSSFIEHLQSISSEVIDLNFPDHHDYSKNNILHIEHKLKQYSKDECIIVITEKDKAKFDALKLPDSIKERIFCLGIKIEFIFDGEKEFDSFIKKFAKTITKNK